MTVRAVTHALHGRFTIRMAASSEASDPIPSDGNEAGSSSQAAISIAPSFLSKFQAPTHSELIRKWKVRVNPPPHTGARKKPAYLINPKGVSVAQRVKNSLVK